MVGNISGTDFDTPLTKDFEFGVEEVGRIVGHMGIDFDITHT